MTTKQFLPLPYGQDDFDNLKAERLKLPQNQNKWMN